MAFSVTPKDTSGIPISSVYTPNTGFVALQGGPPSTDASNNQSAPATVARQAVTLLVQASAAQTTSGNSIDLSSSAYTEMSVDVNISVVSGSGSPTLVLYVDRKGADGIYYPIWASPTQTGTGTVSDSIGTSMSTRQSLGSTLRLRWTITGTTPSFTFSASLIAK